MDEFVKSFNEVSGIVHKNAVDKGFWDELKPVDWINENYSGLDLGYGGTVVSHRFTYGDMQKAIKAGKQNPEPNKAEKIALMHSELSEMLEGVRKPGPDNHCPEFTNEEIELADNFIRGMDYAEKHGLRLAEAILAKHGFNTGRPYKHGKKF